MSLLGVILFVLSVFLYIIPTAAHFGQLVSEHFPSTPPDVVNFLLRPYLFPLASYQNPYSILHNVDLANLTLLRDELFFYDRRVRKDGGETRRELDKSMKRVVRVPKWGGWLKNSRGSGKGNKEREAVEGRLLGGGKVGRAGGWVGNAVLGGGGGQRVEFALDMLSSDFVVHSTTAGGGFEGGLSESYLCTNTHVTSTCLLSSDHFTLPHHPPPPSLPFTSLSSSTTTLRIPFIHCNPHRATLSTRLPPGAIWGMAFPSLSQSGQPSLLSHLHLSTPLFQGSTGKVVLKRPLWSFATISPMEAILTLGGTVTEFAPEMEWRWIELKGQVEGYWEVVMQSVFVEGIRVLRGIPRVVIDVSCALIIGPGEMVEVIWGFVDGARRLWEVVGEVNMDYAEWNLDREAIEGEWWVYPCLNEPLIQLEFAGWGFPVERVGLGRIAEGSGYCVGSIVGWPKHNRTDGVNTNPERHQIHEKEDEDRGGDEERVWVLGGPFWAGVIGVFDFDRKRVGMRTP